MSGMMLTDFVASMSILSVKAVSDLFRILPEGTTY